MRFYLKMRNYLKYAQQSQNGILEKNVGQQWYPNQLYGSPFNIMCSMGNPLITDAKKLTLRSFYLLDFKPGM